MPSTILHPDHYAALKSRLQPDRWLVVALCADWCLTCKAYAAPFAALAERYPDVEFIWADIEDESDFLHDPAIDNFPTLLIQRGADICFYGTVLPDVAVAARLLDSCRSAPQTQDTSEAPNLYQLLQAV